MPLGLWKYIVWDFHGQHLYLINFLSHYKIMAPGAIKGEVYWTWFFPSLCPNVKNIENNLNKIIYSCLLDKYYGKYFWLSLKNQVWFFRISFLVEVIFIFLHMAQNVPLFLEKSLPYCLFIVLLHYSSLHDIIFSAAMSKLFP